MGTNLPQSMVGKLEWFETRTPLWNPDPPGIGLSIAQATEIINRTALAREAYNAALAARATSKAATQAWHDAAESMHTYGADLISTIKAFAETTDDPGVYDTAQVSPPSPPGQLPPPNQPADVTTLLRNDGVIDVRWKGAQPAGTRYTIHRRLAGENIFTLIGDSGSDKMFLDGGVPQGTTTATYYIVARRGEQASPASEQTTIAFGIGGNQGQGGQLTLAA
jgi:hypothetical protein